MTTGALVTLDAEQLRQAALRQIREGAPEAALSLFDQALSLSAEEDLRELVVINKAGVLIDLGLDGPEVRELPQIVMRRSCAKHTFLAACHLHARHSKLGEFRRAYTYGRVALDLVDEIDEPSWRFAVLVDMGNACVFDSRISEARHYYNEVLAEIDGSSENALGRACATQNLGYCLMLEGEVESGIAKIHEAERLMAEAGCPEYAAVERYIDLCYGYLEIGDFDNANRFGRLGLELASEDRQIRNAHYLLGEAAYQQGDLRVAETHFEHLARFYPEFPQLKNLLVAFDLRSIINLRL